MISRIFSIFIFVFALSPSAKGGFPFLTFGSLSRRAGETEKDKK